MPDPKTVATIKAAFSKDWNKLTPEGKADLLHYLVDDTLDIIQYAWAFETYLPDIDKMLDDSDEPMVGSFADVRGICWNQVKDLMLGIPEWSDKTPTNWEAAKAILVGKAPMSRVCASFDFREWLFWATIVYDDAMARGANDLEVVKDLCDFYVLHGGAQLDVKAAIRNLSWR